MSNAEPYVRVVDEIRALSQVVQSTVAPAANVDAAMHLLAQAKELLGDGERRPAWHEVVDADLRRGRNRDFSPWSGSLNPVAPPMRFEKGERDGQECLQGRVTLTTLREGPPQIAHGGVIAGLFDEIMAASRGHAMGGLAVTAKLWVRFAKQTPADREVVFRAWVAEQRGRRVSMAAECVIAATLDDDQPTVTAQAEALFLCQ